jgi:hypothetical protein
VRADQEEEAVVGIVQTGFWRHYKGGIYFVLSVAETHHHIGDFDVVYYSMQHGDALGGPRRPVTRPLRRDSRNQDSWLDEVEWPDGVKRTRFVPIDEPTTAVPVAASEGGSGVDPWRMLSERICAVLRQYQCPLPPDLIARVINAPEDETFEALRRLDARGVINWLGGSQDDVTLAAKP